MNKIIWAVDIAHDPADSLNMVKELRIWAKKLNAVIQPVSVVISNMFPAIQYPGENFNQIALRRFQNYLKKARATDFNSPYLISCPTLSNRKMARELVQYAVKENATFIFSHTRLRSHWNPLRMGGFAETLSAISPVPVLLMNLKNQSTPIQSILLPTDLSSMSHRTLCQLIPLATAFRSKIVLFNQVEDIPMYYPVIDSLSQLQLAELQTITEDIEKKRNLKIKKWTSLLDQQGLKNMAQIQRQKSYLSKDIVRAAKANKVQLIALTGDNGIFSQASLSSSIKDIIMQATTPVLIINRTPKMYLLNEKASDTKPRLSKKVSPANEVASL